MMANGEAGVRSEIEEMLAKVVTVPGEAVCKSHACIDAQNTFVVRAASGLPPY